MLHDRWLRSERRKGIARYATIKKKNRKASEESGKINDTKQEACHLDRRLRIQLFENHYYIEERIYV